MTMKRLIGLAAATAAALALAGCAGGEGDGGDAGTGGGGDAAACANTIVNPEAEQVTVWAWYPAFEGVVDVFNQNHDDVQVCWVNAGVGKDVYPKFSTALEAGSGAPDVIQLENEVIPSFTIRDGLVDLVEYGIGEKEDQYAPGAWSDVSSGDAVYAVPVGAPNAIAGQAMIAHFISDIEGQKALVNEITYTTDVVGLDSSSYGGDVAPWIVAGDNAKKAIEENATYYAQHITEVVDRFNRWVALN